MVIRYTARKMKDDEVWRTIRTRDKKIAKVAETYLHYMGRRYGCDEYCDLGDVDVWLLFERDVIDAV